MSSSEKPKLDFAAPVPAELESLGRAVGELMDEMLRVDSGDPGFAADMQDAIERVRGAAERLRPHGRELERVELAQSGTTRSGARPYYVSGSLVGPHNPTFPSMEFHYAEGCSSGTVCFPLHFEGPPASLHGGVVALFFDQVLGHHNIVAGVPAMTGTLTIRYHRPTPLFRSLRFEVRSEAAKDHDRKLTNRGQLWDGEELVAEAEGLFIRPRRHWKWSEEYGSDDA